MKKRQHPHQARFVTTHAGQEGRMTFFPFRKDELLKFSPAFQEGMRARQMAQEERILQDRVGPILRKKTVSEVTQEPQKGTWLSMVLKEEK